MKPLLIASAAGILLAACAATPSNNSQVVAGAGTLRLGGTSTAASAPKGLFFERWVKDEDAKDKNGPDALPYR